MLRAVVLGVLVPFFTLRGDACGTGEAPPVADPPGTMISLGQAHGCTLKVGRVFCFGANESGQLGTGSITPFETRALEVTALPEAIAQVAVGDSLSCARSVSGRVWCWGADSAGQLAREPSGAQPTPVEIVLPAPIVQLSAGSDFVLALGSDGRLFGWGNDFEGTLARANEETPGLRATSPVRVAFEHRFASVSAAQGSACGLDTAGSLWCWGRNVDGQFAAKPPEQFREATHLLDGVSVACASAFHTCVGQGSDLSCSGNLNLGPDSTHLQYAAFTKVAFSGTVKACQGHFLHQCVIDSNQALWCWGRNAEGQLGLGDIAPRSEPTKVRDGVVSVGVGGFSTCLVDRSGEVECMGENNVGQLGLGDTNRRSRPTEQ